MNTGPIEKLLEQLFDEKKQKEPWNGSDIPFAVGKAYFIRTVTYHLLGKVEKIAGNFLVLSDASWVADSGRFWKAIGEGELNEVEFVGDAIVSMTAICDAFPWVHKIPKETK